MKTRKFFPLVLLLGVLFALSLFAVTASAEGNVAKIGETEYATLKEAVAAVADDTPTEITLLRDVTDGDGIEIPSGRNITIDLGGFTYQVTAGFVGSEGTQTNAFRFLKDSSVTVKNGTLKSTSSSAHIVIQNYSNLTLDGVTVEGGKFLTYTKYLLSCNCGDTKLINGTKLSTVTTSQYALSVYYGMSGCEEGVSVWADGTVKLYNYVEYAKADGVSDEDFRAKAKLTLSSEIAQKSRGTFPSGSGYVWLNNGDGTLTPVLKTEAPIQVGTSYYYAKLADAVAVGGTVKLLADISMDEGLLINTKTTLDLNGHTLTVNDGGNVNNRCIKVTDSASGIKVNLIVKSSAEGGKIIAGGSCSTADHSTNGANAGSGCYGAIRFESSGKLTMTDVTLENSRPWGMNIKLISGTAELNNVTIHSTCGGGIEVAGATAVLNNCTMTQENYHDHASSCVSVSSEATPGVVTINGGSYTSKDGTALYVFSSGGTMIVNGGTFEGGKNVLKADLDAASYPVGQATVMLNDGDYSGSIATGGAGEKKIEVSGGKYTVDVASYLAADCGVTAADGTYTVVPGYYVALVGEVKYSTLADAVTAAQAGDTVTLLCDYTDPHPANTYYAYDLTGKTLDLNGFTFTSVNTGCSFEGTGGMIRNGKMVCADGGSYALFIGDMGTTESFIVDGVEMTGGINVFNASGVVLRNLTVAGTKYYAVWLDENAFATVESGTYTAGNVALFSGCKATADDGSVVVSTLTVTDGTFVTNDKPVFGGAGGAFSVSGGTFDKDDAKTYVVSGYYLKDNGNGTYTVIESPATIVDTAANMTTEVTLDGLASNSAIDHEAGATYKVVVSTAPAEDIAAANEKISASNDTNTNKAIFDISVIKTDSEGASTDISGAIVNQQVTLTLEETPAQDSIVHVYHVKGDTVEEIKPVTVSGNTVTFTAPSFSTYAVTFSTGAETIRFGSALTIVNQPTVEYNGGVYSPVDIYFGIDALAYQEVGVEYRLVVTGDNATETSGTKSTTVVYSAMNVTTTAGEQKTYTPADLNASYMYGQRFLFDTTKYTRDAVTLYVKPYAVSLDGTETYYGEEITLSEDVCVNNGTHLFADAQ